MRFMMLLSPRGFGAVKAILERWDVQEAIMERCDMHIIGERTRVRRTVATGHADAWCDHARHRASVPAANTLDFGKRRQLFRIIDAVHRASGASGRLCGARRRPGPERRCARERYTQQIRRS